MFDYISSYILIVPKKDSYEKKTVTICCTFHLFSCGEIIIEIICGFQRYFPKSNKSILFYLIDPSSILRLQEVSYGHTSPTRSVSISIYIWIHSAFHPPTFSESKEQRKETAISPKQHLHIQFSVFDIHILTHMSFYFLIIVRSTCINLGFRENLSKQ